MSDTPRYQVTVDGKPVEWNIPKTEVLHLIAKYLIPELTSGDHKQIEIKPYKK